MSSRDRAQMKGLQLRRDVAEYLLSVEPGWRMPTIRHLASLFGGSLGATQSVVAALEDEGAIRTTSRGRKGAVLEDRSVGRLWAAARDEPFVVTLPLPSSRRVHALATALKACLAATGIETYLGFIRGANNRVAALRGGRCHAAVVSALAAEALTGPDAEVALVLPPGSYVLEHRVLRRTGSDGRPVTPRRVGVDLDSFDFLRLSELEFPAPAERVAGPYMHLMELLNQGRIDATVWDAEETFAIPGERVVDQPLTASTRAAIGDANTAASVMVRRDDPARVLIRSALGVPGLRAIQEDVLEGRRTAEY